MNAGARVRALLDAQGPIVCPGIYDCLSAKVVERAGLSCAFISGAAVTASRLGYPDYNDVKLATPEGGNDAVHEAEELDTAAPLCMRRDDPSGGDFERGKQGRGAVPLVVVALAGQGASIRRLQIALRPLQCLDRRLFVDTENNCLGRRIDIKADHIGGFRHELRVVALAPGLAGGKVDIVLTQEAPDILKINVAQGLASSGPVHRA